MLKGANMISSSRKRIPEKIQPTRKWEQPKPTDFEELRPKAKQSHKVVGNNKIVLLIQIQKEREIKMTSLEK